MLKKSVTIAGQHNTSVSIEPEFWEELGQISERENLSINSLITKIDAERKSDNLSSAIRVYVLNYLKTNR